MIIFDIEGVLIDNSERFKTALARIDRSAKKPEELDARSRTVFWKIFLNPDLSRKLDRINKAGVEYLIEKLRQGKNIILLSGAPKEIVLIHLEKIRQYLHQRGIKENFSRVIWRGRNDKRKAEEFKLDMIRKLRLFFNEEIEEIHDDNPFVIETLKKFARKAFLWEKCRISKVFEHK